MTDTLSDCDHMLRTLEVVSTTTLLLDRVDLSGDLVVRIEAEEELRTECTAL